MIPMRITSQRLPSWKQPQHPCRSHKPCILCMRGCTRRTGGTLQCWWDSRASKRSNVFSSFSNEKPFSSVLPSLTSIGIKRFLICYYFLFSSSFSLARISASGASLGSISLVLQSHAPSLRFLPHLWQRPLQSSEQRNLIGNSISSCS